MNLALQLANLAGATATELTGRRNVEAARPGNLENRVGFLALRLAARQCKADDRRRAGLRHDVVMLGDLLFDADRSAEHTSELQSLMRISYAVFCLNKTTQSTPE